MAIKAACAILAGALLLGAQTPGELERTEKTIQLLTEFKARVRDLEADIDRLLRELSEHRGQLQAQPGARPAAPAAKPWSGFSQIEPDRKPAVGRCAAITAKGTRCSRAATSGQRYCKQHQLANSK
jgi:hypothetical protein